MILITQALLMALGLLVYILFARRERKKIERELNEIIEMFMKRDSEKKKYLEKPQ